MIDTVSLKDRLDLVASASVSEVYLRRLSRSLQAMPDQGRSLNSALRSGLAEHVASVVIL